MAGLGLDSIYEDEDAAEKKPVLRTTSQENAPSANVGGAVAPPSAAPSAAPAVAVARPPTVEQAAKEGGKVVKDVFGYLNPIHLKEGVKEFKTYEDVDPYATGAHGIADLTALYGLKKIAQGVGEGVSSRIANTIKGVDPTIKAQIEQSDKALQMKYGQQQGKLNPVATPVGRVEPTFTPEPLAPQAGQPSTAAPVPEAEPVATTKQAKTAAIPTEQQSVSSLQTYANKMLEDARMPNISLEELSQRARIEIRDQRDVQKALKIIAGGEPIGKGEISKNIKTRRMDLTVPIEKKPVAPILSEAEQHYNVTAKTPIEKQLLEESYRNKMSKQGGFVNPSVMGEALTTAGRAIAPPVAQFARGVGANLVGAAPMIPLAMATDVQNQNRGYRREIEQELNRNNDPARHQQLLNELSKLDNETYLKGIQGRFINKTIPSIYR